MSRRPTSLKGSPLCNSRAYQARCPCEGHDPAQSVLVRFRGRHAPTENPLLRREGPDADASQSHVRQVARPSGSACGGAVHSGREIGAQLGRYRALQEACWRKPNGAMGLGINNLAQIRPELVGLAG